MSSLVLVLHVMACLFVVAFNDILILLAGMLCMLCFVFVYVY